VLKKKEQAKQEGGAHGRHCETDRCQYLPPSGDIEHGTTDCEKRRGGERTSNWAPLGDEGSYFRGERHTKGICEKRGRGIVFF